MYNPQVIEVFLRPDNFDKLAKLSDWLPQLKSIRFPRLRRKKFHANEESVATLEVFNYLVLFELSFFPFKSPGENPELLNVFLIVKLQKKPSNVNKDVAEPFFVGLEISAEDIYLYKVVEMHEKSKFFEKLSPLILWGYYFDHFGFFSGFLRHSFDYCSWSKTLDYGSSSLKLFDNSLEGKLRDSRSSILGVT